MSRASKREVYSWRLSAKLKAELEAAARDEKANIDTILDRLVREWLAKRVRIMSYDDEQGMRHSGLMERPSRYKRGRPPATGEDAERQRQLRDAALKAAGTVSIGLGPYTNQRVREVMGEALEKKYRESQRRAPRRSR
jgi:hypothetical protein